MPGLAARALAVEAVRGVLEHGSPLEEAFEGPAAAGLDTRDLALARMVAGVTMRRHGTLMALLSGLMERGLPRKAGPLAAILETAAAQILFLDVPDHAAVDLAVRLARADSRAQAFAGLANAVLRRLGTERQERLAAVPAGADTPAWLLARWRTAYGDAADAVSMAHRQEPTLDLSVRADADLWAERLGGRMLPTGSVRIGAGHGPVPALPGFAEGAWWVQDAAAALPARLLLGGLGAAEGRRVADLCAAPGGKTAQLAAAGARVVAFDRSAPRLERLNANMRRLGLEVRTAVADILNPEFEAEAMRDGPFDAVLLDAPCMATGTIRRHPDVAWSKGPSDLSSLAAQQRRFLERAAALTAPGGLLVYCTCSLEPEEGEQQAEAFLAARADFARVPVRPEEIGGLATAVTPAGDLRTLPSMLPDGEPEAPAPSRPDAAGDDQARRGGMGGLDGFFAVRLRRLA